MPANLISFVGDELLEVGGRARHRTHLHLRLGDARIDLLVELVGDLDGLFLRKSVANRWLAS
jgi:hypothetical protein